MRKKDLPKSQIYTRQGKKGFCRSRHARKEGAIAKQVGTAPAHLPPRPPTFPPREAVTFRCATDSQCACYPQVCY